MGLTPKSSRGGMLTHACTEGSNRTLCGRTIQVSATWMPRQLPRLFAGGGYCSQCASQLPPAMRDAVAVEVAALEVWRAAMPYRSRNLLSEPS